MKFFFVEGREFISVGRLNDKDIVEESFQEIDFMIGWAKDRVREFCRLNNWSFECQDGECIRQTEPVEECGDCANFLKENESCSALCPPFVRIPNFGYVGKHGKYAENCGLYTPVLPNFGMESRTSYRGQD